MKFKLLILLSILFFSCEDDSPTEPSDDGGGGQSDSGGSNSNVTCEIESLDMEVNTLCINGGEIWFYVNSEIAGFQFDTIGATIIDASGGEAEDAGFTVSVGSGVVLGFSFSGDRITSGCGILTILNHSGFLSNIHGIVFSGPDGVEFDVALASQGFCQ